MTCRQVKWTSWRIGPMSFSESDDICPKRDNYQSKKLVKGSSSEELSSKGQSLKDFRAPGRVGL